MTLAIDTLQLARSLAEAGMERAQAEAVSSSLARSLKDSDVATKADIEALRKDIRGEFDGLRKELKGDIESSRKDAKIDVANLRTEIAASRNQTILSMIAIAGLMLAVMRLLP
jgi:hypothetical protein